MPSALSRRLARLEAQSKHLEQFGAYPPIIRRIASDKPPCWEHRLMAELLRHLNDPLFRELQDLRDGLCVGELEHLDHRQFYRWAAERVREIPRVVSPIRELAARLTAALGEPGTPGDVDEIHHLCRLVHDYVGGVVRYERRVRFVSVLDEDEPLVELLRDTLGSQVSKLATIPDSLDDIACKVASADDKPDGNTELFVVRIHIERPERWEADIRREFDQLKQRACA